MSAVLAAAAVALAAASWRPRTVEAAPYLGASDGPVASARPRLEMTAPAVGALAGVAAATVLGPASLVSFGVVGAGIGWMIEKVSGASRDRRRARRMKQELPTIAEALALHVQAGDSVSGAIDRVTDECRGVTAEKLDNARGHPGGLEAGLLEASAQARVAEAARLFDLLAQAQRVGGRLGESLSALARDLRSGLMHDLTTEGGRRSLAAYGPILLFMVPVTLVFLMYPTLAIFSSLSSNS